jgi:hypothetical protein
MRTVRFARSTWEVEIRCSGGEPIFASRSTATTIPGE